MSGTTVSSDRLCHVMWKSFPIKSKMSDSHRTAMVNTLSRLFSSALFLLSVSIHALATGCPDSVSADHWQETLVADQKTRGALISTLNGCLRDDPDRQVFVDGWAVSSIPLLDELPDEKKAGAASFLERALRANADAGYPPSQHNYAALFNARPGSTLAALIKQDQKQFGKWSRIAASHGEPRALFNLAVRMAVGVPTAEIEKDHVTAYQLLVRLEELSSGNDRLKELEPIISNIKAGIERELGEQRVRELLPMAASLNLSILSPELHGAISMIEKSYISPLDRANLNRLCLAGMREHEEQLPIDSCLTAIVGSLDARSIYMGADRAREILMKSKSADTKPQAIRSDDLFNGALLYVSIRDFLDDAKNSLLRQVGERLAHGQPRGLILDLRNCSRALVPSVVDVAGVFLPGNTLVGYAESRRGLLETERYFTSQKNENAVAILRTIPIVVLVNGKTAGGAEFLAAAVRDSDRATIVGSATGRRGTVQTVLPLSTNGFVKLTTHAWKSPRGRSIEDAGVAIDFEIAAGDAPSAAKDLESDPVVMRAQTMLGLVSRQ